MHRRRYSHFFPILTAVCAVGIIFFIHSALAVSTFTVDSTADTADFSAGDGFCDIDDGVGDGPCTLRAAIEEANATVGTDTINFGISGTGVKTITLASALPVITEAVTINGETQTGSSCGDLWGGVAPTWNVLIDGGGTIGAGLTTSVGGNSFKGLAITGFTGGGIVINGGSGNAVTCNNLYSNPYGVVVDSQVDTPGTISATTIGGTTAGDGNLLAGNTNSGIRVTKAGVTGTTIQGNFIGTNAAGTAASANGSGISIDTNAVSTTVGGTTAGARNLISGNTQRGISVSGASTTGVVIQGNYIGTNAAGTAAVGNTQDGINISQSPAVTIGGTDAGAKNVISGNGISGLAIVGGATDALVQGNYIGTNAAGTAAVANATTGVSVNTAATATIGGTAAGAGNVISGNTQTGLDITNSTGTTVQGNYIGTNAAGTAALANGGNGIWVSTTSSSTTIGGTAAGAKNVISGNTLDGLEINGVSSTTVQGNYIGTNAAGTAALGNGGFGLDINATLTTIGGTAAGAGNIISGNTTTGINVNGNDATGTVIQGNKIGTDVTGAVDLGNAQWGIMSGSPTTVIGGTAAGAGNTIFGNNSGGVMISSASATSNTILRNSIYNNNGVGIELTVGSAEVDTNDTDDPDTGANNFQNYPVLTSAGTDGATTSVIGTLNSLASTSFRLEFFASPLPGRRDGADTANFGEGQTYLGTTTVVTDAGGDVSFTASGLTATTAGYILSATASEVLLGGAYSTSEFSANVTVNAPSFSAATLAPTNTFVGTTTTMTTTAARPGGIGTLSLYVCKAADGTSAGCGVGGTWCSATGQGDNPSCNLTLTSGDVGIQSAYTYVFNGTIGASSNGTASVFSVNAEPVVGANTATFIIAASADNGAVLKTDSSYPPGGSAIASEDDSNYFLLARTNLGAYYVFNLLWRWDTSGLPDNATATSASTGCYVKEAPVFSDLGSRNVTADWYTSWPISADDYSFTPQTTALASYPISSITHSAGGTLNTIPLDNTTGVSVAGYTGLRLHIDGGEPADFGAIVPCVPRSADATKAARLTVSYTVPDPNTAPSFTAGPSDGSSAGTTPTNVSSNVTFTATATDAESDQYYLAVCKTNAVTVGSNAAPTCDGGSWAISSATDSGSQASVTYTTLTADAESNAWYAFVCDKTASSPACSSSSQGTGDAGSPFKVNHVPTFSAVSDSPDPQVVGSNITFAATASDSDTDTLADTVKLYVCKANDATSSGCGAGGTWASASLTASNPSTTYTALLADRGSNTYYAFIYDSHNVGSASNSRSGTFVVSNQAPAISAGPSDGSSAVATPTNVGSNVTFTATATDGEDDQYYLAICKTDAVTAGDNTAPTCDGGAWAISSATNSAAQATVSYTSLVADSATNNWFAFVCDKTSTSPVCSSSSQGSGVTGSPFIVNQRPTFTAFATAATEPALTGTAISFTTISSDPEGDLLSLYVCKTTDGTSSGCGAGGTWCSATATSNPSCSFTPASGDAGNASFVAYIYDSHNAAASTNPQTLTRTIRIPSGGSYYFSNNAPAPSSPPPTSPSTPPVTPAGNNTANTGNTPNDNNTPSACTLPRNISQERLTLSLFKRLIGHFPKLSQEWQAFQILVYGRSPCDARDLTLERQGISKFRAFYRRLPRTSLDWRIVHFFGYGGL